MDGGTFATGLAVGLFIGAIGGAFAVCVLSAASESRQYRPTWPDVPDPEPARLRVVPNPDRPAKRKRQKSYS